MKRANKIAGEYLRAPYARILIPDEESGTYTAEILEFPGCLSQGDTPEEALRNLEDAAEGWIQASLDLGQEIPIPSADNEYDNKIALRLPRSLHKQAARMAEREGVSLNQFLLTAIAARVGAEDIYARMLARFEEKIVVATSKKSLVEVVNKPMRITTSKGKRKIRPDML